MPVTAADTTPDDPASLTVAEASALIEGGALSPVALTEAALARVETTEGRLNAFVLVLREEAMTAARAAEERARHGARRGPLDGIPVAVKDLFDTAGSTTAGGTDAFRDRVPTQDATAVRRLREAGAVILGKTNTHELALGGTTNNPWFGPTHNPWSLDRVPGGSSGGSGAAVAAGQAPLALGTDTGGSIRIPAAFCGVTGHKPTYGLVGRGGVIPLSQTLDHAGPLARTALDCALALNALAGHDPRDAESIARPAEDYTARIAEGIAGMRLAVIPSLVDGCIPAVQQAFAASLDTLRRLGAEIVEVEPMTDDWRAPLAPIIVCEGAANVETVLRETPERIGALTRERLELGLATSGTEYARALRWRIEVERHFEAALRDHRLHAYLAPTALDVAEPIDDASIEHAPATKFRNTSTFDHTHQPSISVPNGLDAAGLPTGLMISGAQWDDATVLRIAHAYQQVTDWHLRRPVL